VDIIWTFYIYICLCEYKKQKGFTVSLQIDDYYYNAVIIFRVIKSFADKETERLNIEGRI